MPPTLLSPNRLLGGSCAPQEPGMKSGPRNSGDMKRGQAGKHGGSRREKVKGDLQTNNVAIPRIQFARKSVLSPAERCDLGVHSLSGNRLERLGQHVVANQPQTRALFFRRWVPPDASPSSVRKRGAWGVFLKLVHARTFHAFEAMREWWVGFLARGK